MKTNRKVKRLSALILSFLMMFSVVQNIVLQPETVEAANVVTSIDVSSTVTSSKSIKEQTKNDTYQVRDVICSFDDSSINRATSEHFQIIWGNGDTTGTVTYDFIVGNLINLENIRSFYINELGMKDIGISQNRNITGLYKTNVYVSGTGLSQFEDDWAYMSVDSGAFAYLFVAPGAMRVDEPSWVIPHELAHVFTYHQGGSIAYAWYEATANWFRDQYLGSEYYAYGGRTYGPTSDFFAPYMINSSYYVPHMLNWYDTWPIFLYISENPDNIDGLGMELMHKIFQHKGDTESMYDTIQNLSGVSIKTILGGMSRRLATMDFSRQEHYLNRLNNETLRISGNYEKIYTTLNGADSNGWQSVPSNKAPMQTGFNIIPLDVDLTKNKISVEFLSTSGETGADFRTSIVTSTSSNYTRYSNMLSGDGTTEIKLNGDETKAYLVVCATPDTIKKFEVDWSSSDKDESTRFSYKVRITTSDEDVSNGGGSSDNPGGSISAESVVHNFTENGKTSSFYNISGSLSKDKGSMLYDGKSLTQCLKMESATNISFTTSTKGTLTLVFGGSESASGKKVKVNGTSYTCDNSGIVSVDISAGSVTIAKGDSINLFYMVYTPESTGGSDENDTPTYKDASIADGYYFVKNVNSNLYMDVKNGASGNGVNIQQSAFTGGNSQIFQIKSDGEGHYYILTCASGYSGCVDVFDGLADNGTNIEQWAYWGGYMQKYRAIDAGNGAIAFLTMASDFVGALDVYGATTENGGNINQWEYHGGAGQLWTLETAPSSHKHSYTSSVTKTPSCSETGIKTYVCLCGETYTEKIETVAHDYESWWTVDVPATETTAGSGSRHCKNCEAKTDIRVIPATGATEKLNGLNKVDGIWGYYVDGTVDTGYTGFADNETGTWYVVNGIVNLKATGLYKINGIWYYLRGNKLQSSYTGIATNASGVWYVEKGIVSLKATGLYKISGTWYYISGSKVQSDYTGIMSNVSGKWYVEKGIVSLKYNGTVTIGTVTYTISGSKVVGEKDEAELKKINGTWYYMIDGIIAIDYTGLADNSSGTWYVKNGVVSLKASGLYKINGTWYYLSGSKVQSEYTGFATNSSGKWYVENGVVTLKYNGNVTLAGITYKVVNSKVQ